MLSSEFGKGNSKANSLYWAASRPSPLLGFNASKPAAPIVLPRACSANSACDAIGRLVDCYCVALKRWFSLVL